MTCFHGLGSSVLDYAISNTHVLNHITNFELLDDYEFDSDQRTLSLTLNLVIHTSHMQETIESQRRTHFDRSNIDLFLKDLERDLGSLTYNNNIDQIYYKFTTTLSTTINKFSIEVLYKKITELLTLVMTKTVKLPRK